MVDAEAGTVGSSLVLLKCGSFDQKSAIGRTRPCTSSEVVLPTTSSEVPDADSGARESGHDHGAEPGRRTLGTAVDPSPRAVAPARLHGGRVLLRRSDRGHDPERRGLARRPGAAAG